ncbi:MAG TPA: tetratricopeptide repeat protein, partial [Magnetococcales bacterium]|nr:tetratricopeptide repeat protein [Magnetococcales bacterium]
MGWPAWLVLTLMLVGGCAAPVFDAPTRPVEKGVKADKVDKIEKGVALPLPHPMRSGVSGRPDAMIAEARGLVEKNRIDAAKGLYRRVIQDFELTPQANEARYRLGEALLLEGRNDEALSSLTDAASRSSQPFSWESLSLAGDIQAQRGDLQGAWASWVKVAYSPSPLSGVAWTRFLKSYTQYGDAENTQHLFQAMPPGQLSNEHARTALATVDLVETERLKQLHAFQPSGSPLTSLFASILGGRQALERGGMGAQNEAQPAMGETFTALENQHQLVPPDNQPGFTVGLLLPLSGNYASHGKNLLKAANMALHDYPDTRIILRVADSRGTAEGARLAMEQFRLDGVGAVIGPIFHEEAKAAAEVAASSNIPIMILNPRPGIVQPGSQIFQNAFQPENEGQFMARFAVEEKKIRRVAVLAPDTEYGHLLTQSFSDVVQQLGGTVVRVTFFPSGSRDFSPWIKALVNADPKDIQSRSQGKRQDDTLDPVEPLASGKDTNLRPWSDFDALFLPANAQEVRLIAPQAAFFKLRQPNVLFLGTSLWNKPELLKEGTEFIRGAFFCDTD